MTQSEDLATIRAQLTSVMALLERVLSELLDAMREGTAADVATAVAASAETDARRARVAVCESHTRELEAIRKVLEEIADAKTAAAKTAASRWSVARQVLVPAATFAAGVLALWFAEKLGVNGASVAALLGGS